LYIPVKESGEIVLQFIRQTKAGEELFIVRQRKHHNPVHNGIPACFTKLHDPLKEGRGREIIEVILPLP
jgi:hypothetical protein